MKKIVVFGATGGLGVKLVPLLEKKYQVISLNSKMVNITNIDEVINFFETNNVDIVLNMAGKSYDTYLSKVNKNNYDIMIDSFNVNTVGMINLIIGCLPQMIEKRWGRIIAISSVLSEKNVPKTSVYAASKAFIDRLICVVNKENIKYGITCNSIQLGYWDGGMCDRINPKFRNEVKNSIGLKRWGSAEELYNTIDYLIENEYICGTNLKIDGGL